MKDIEGIEGALEVLRPHWSEIEADFDRHNARFLDMASAQHDPIGRILKIHLIIESFIESFLEDHFGLENVRELRLSFYQKASLLPSHHSSASFVRPGILQINTLRNKFGHSLGHKIRSHELSAVYQVLEMARRSSRFASDLEAIEAFAPVACAFLSVPPKHLQEKFIEAFAKVHSYIPESVQEERPT